MAKLIGKGTCLRACISIGFFSSAISTTVSNGLASSGTFGIAKVSIGRGLSCSDVVVDNLDFSKVEGVAERLASGLALCASGAFSETGIVFNGLIETSTPVPFLVELGNSSLL